MPEIDEIARRNALLSLGVLDTAPEERFDRIVRLARELFEVPMALVTLVDDERVYHKAMAGFDEPEVPRTHAFCTYTIAETDALVVPDARLDSRFRNNPYVEQDGGVAFYVGQPLMPPGGTQAVGALCIIDTKPREISPTQLALLRELADWVEQELANSSELQRAADVQQRLLPRTTPQLDGYTLAGRCIPARMVGGDFFDWYVEGTMAQFVLADVMGKGIPAAIIGASVRTVLRGVAKFHSDLASGLRRAAGTLQADLNDTATFVTVFAGRLDTETHMLTYVDAGHGLAQLICASGEAKVLVSDGLPMGVVEDYEWTSAGVSLAPGDVLLIVSDGFLELYPDAEQAQEAVADAVRSSDSAQQIVERLESSSRRFAAHDDLTFVVLRRDS